MITIPFNKPHLAGNEFLYMAQAVESGHISGDGPFTMKCRDFLEKRYGVSRVLLTTSGTAALEMAALLCRVGPGDEIILPSFTFVSTANAFVLRGASPVFVDIRPDTLNMDEAHVKDCIGPRTRVIVPVHYAGVGCEMDALEELAKGCGARIVEDAAHAIDARYRNRPLGTIGSLGAISFHETKNISCGEGGALFINDSSFIERAEILREKGANRSKFFRGEVDKYTWVDIGSSYLLSDLQAAYLLAQLERLESIAERRRRISENYRQALAALEEGGLLKLPVTPAHCQGNHHMFHLLLETEEARDGLLGFLKSRGILAVFHYLPLHLSPMGRTFGGREGQLPVTESVSRRLVRLPFYNDLSSADQETVIRSVYAFFGR
jgi:dTDP-4-amino-4,6-dideoxygalactose transaminase